jgi:hypothetical protein
VTYPLKNFEKKIDLRVYERGVEYYFQGRIKHIFKIDDTEWQAIVEGFDDYTVFIKIEDETLAHWECNCPYHDTAICQHVVAVLYMIRKEGDGAVKNDKSGFEEIKETISYLPPHVLRYLILKFSADNKNFRNFVAEYLKSQNKF